MVTVYVAVIVGVVIVYMLKWGYILKGITYWLLFLIQGSYIQGRSSILGLLDHILLQSNV